MVGDDNGEISGVVHGNSDEGRGLLDPSSTGEGGLVRTVGYWR